MNKISTRRFTIIAMTAALYATLCIVLFPVSYGLIQIRIAEALTLLAVFSPNMVLAITLGCAISNFVGVLIGANALVIDIFFGTLATGIAGCLSYRLRGFKMGRYYLASALPPVLVNALILGAEFTWLETGGLLRNQVLFFGNMLYIILGQALPCLVLGPLLVIMLENTGLAKRYLLPQ